MRERHEAGYLDESDYHIVEQWPRDPSRPSVSSSWFVPVWSFRSFWKREEGICLCDSSTWQHVESQCQHQAHPAVSRLADKADRDCKIPCCSIFHIFLHRWEIRLGSSRWKEPIKFTLGRNQSCPANHTSEKHCLGKCFTQDHWWDSWRHTQSIERWNAIFTEKWMNNNPGFDSRHSSFASLETNIKNKYCSLYMCSETLNLGIRKILNIVQVKWCCNKTLWTTHESVKKQRPHKPS